MILEDKIDLIHQFKLIKEKLYFQYILLFISFIFLPIMAFFGLVAIIDPSFYGRSFPQNSNKSIGYLVISIIFILLFWACFYGFTKTMSIIMINKYFEFNIFRALKWFKIYLIINFHYDIFKMINAKNSTSDKLNTNLISFFDSKGLVLYGGGSINFAYNDFWRENNDLDFASASNETKYIDTKSLENLEEKFKDFAASKYQYNNIKIEVLYLKYIPKRFITTKNNIKIPNINFMIAMKMHQILHLYLVNNDDKISKLDYEAKIKNSYIDLAFLLSKNNYWNYKKITEAFSHLYLSNYFLQFYLNKNIFDFSKPQNTEKFLEFVKLNNSKNINFSEVYLFIRNFVKLIDKNIFIKNIGDGINKILENKHSLYDKFINEPKLNKNNFSSLKWTFANEHEKNDFLNKYYKNIDVQNPIVNCFLNELNGTDNNMLDVRKILLYELNQKMELVYESKK